MLKKQLNVYVTLGYKLQKSTSIHDYSLFSPLGVHLELHFSLIQEDCLEKANYILENAWDYTINVNANIKVSHLTGIRS